jgi:hypothetical protein
VARAIGFGSAIFVAYAIVALAGLSLYWVEFGLVLAAVVGVAAVVARAGGDRTFLKASGVSCLTVLCMESFDYVQLFTGPATAQPEILPPTATTMVLSMVWLSLMCGGMAGGIALGIRSFQARTATGQ